MTGQGRDLARLVPFRTNKVSDQILTRHPVDAQPLEDSLDINQRVNPDRFTYEKTDSRFMFVAWRACSSTGVLPIGPDTYRITGSAIIALAVG